MFHVSETHDKSTRLVAIPACITGGGVVLLVPLVVRGNQDVRPLGRGIAGLGAERSPLPAIERRVLLHVVLVVEVVVRSIGRRMPAFVDPALDDARDLQGLAIAPYAAPVVRRHVVVLGYLREVLGKEDAPALLVRKGIRPLEREVLAVAGLVEPVFVLAVRMVAVPCTPQDLPVLVYVLGAETRVHHEDRGVLGMLCRVDVRVVRVRQRDVRPERKTLTDLKPPGTVDKVRRRGKGNCGYDNRRRNCC